MERVAVVKIPTFTEKSGISRLVAKIDWNGAEKEIWFEFSKEYACNIEIELQDWLLLALLIPAMRDGLTLEFEGSISPILLHNALNDLQSIFTTQFTNLYSINVKAKGKKIQKKNSKRNIGIGFSAGIDSLSSLALLTDSIDIKPTHLATLNVGAIGVGDEANTMLSKYAKRVDSICENEEFIALVIDSNIHDFYKDFTFQSTHTIRTAAAILALGNTFSYYFYSSGFTYNEVLVKRTSDMAQADPILLPLFSNDVTQFRTVGAHLSRLEKVALVFNQPLSYKYLDVCVAPIEERLSKFNCGVCIKCRRQLITLDIFKGLDKYSEVFIIQDYKKTEKGYSTN